MVGVSGVSSNSIGGCCHAAIDRRHDCGHGLDVGRVIAVVTGDEGVLADRTGRQEFLGVAAAHGAGHGRDDAEGQPEPGEYLEVRLAMCGVRRIQAGVVQVEGIAVLHDEFASAQQPGPGPRLVPELRLDLIERHRVVAVGAVKVLYQQREEFLVRRAEQVVGAASILQPEQVVAVLRPAAGLLVRVPRQQ